MAHTTSYNLRNKRVFVAGHRGMVGRALVRRLEREGCELLTVDRANLDLRNQEDVERWILFAKPQAIFLAAATVGGIAANAARPAEFIFDNLAIAANIMEAARLAHVEKLMFLSSACVYPKACPQPMKEEHLMSGPLESTNEPYAMAKLAGMSLARAYRRQYGCDFVSVIPTNLYGPFDNFDPKAGHVIPALMRKMSEAKDGKLEIWGTGSAEREYLHVDDAADAMVFLMQTWSSDEPINIGKGETLSIKNLAVLLTEIAGFKGKFEFDGSKPDGMPKKQLDAERLAALGWNASIKLRDGLTGLYEWYTRNAPAA